MAGSFKEGGKKDFKRNECRKRKKMQREGAREAGKTVTI